VVGREVVEREKGICVIGLRGHGSLIMVTKAAENGVARPKRPHSYRTRSSANAQGPREHRGPTVS